MPATSDVMVELYKEVAIKLYEAITPSGGNYGMVVTDDSAALFRAVICDGIIEIMILGKDAHGNPTNEIHTLNIAENVKFLLGI